MIIPNIDVFQLFPTPIIACNVEIEKKERSFLIEQYPVNVTANTGNLISKDLNILNNPEVQELNKKLLFLVNNAFTHIHNPLYGCNLYITQSWLNFTGKDQYHPRHTHPNSFFSAVLYLQTTEDDCIDFYRPDDPASHNYEIHTSNPGPFNSKLWRIPVKDNLLLVFPSTLPHSVSNVTHNTLRVSLSFNTYLKGEISSPHILNHLIF
jgi:uncharacterized protein (TIGR02466 family)